LLVVLFFDSNNLKINSFFAKYGRGRSSEVQESRSSGVQEYAYGTLREQEYAFGTLREQEFRS
jgi:hypothetical protein